MWLIFSGMFVKVAQSCPTLCDPMDYIVQGILQTRILEWVAFPSSRGSSQPKDWTQVSHIAGTFFTSWATREAQEYWSGWVSYLFSNKSSQPRNQPRVSCIAGRFFTNWAIREAVMFICMLLVCQAWWFKRAHTSVWRLARCCFMGSGCDLYCSLSNTLICACSHDSYCKSLCRFQEIITWLQGLSCNWHNMSLEELYISQNHLQK